MEPSSYHLPKPSSILCETSLEARPSLLPRIMKVENYPIPKGNIKYAWHFITSTRWWFQRFFIFTPKIGEDEPILTRYFSNRLVQPTTSRWFYDFMGGKVTLQYTLSGNLLERRTLLFCSSPPFCPVTKGPSLRGYSGKIEGITEVSRD